MRTRILAAFTVLSVFACADEEVDTVPYQLVPVERRDISVSASAAGVVEPIQTVEVKSKASGEIIEVRVETGDIVQPGELIVRVDPRVPRNAVVQTEADLEVAEAQVANAQAQMQRMERLYETQSVTEQEYENARLALAQARAQRVRAERNLEDARIAFEDTEVKAPLRGIVLQRNVEEGTVIQSATSNVGGGAVLMTMANLDTVQVRTLVDETDIGKISSGMRVTITVDAFPNRPFNGRVLKIEPQAITQQNVTMFPVLIRIANPETLLKPGMNAEVEVNVGSREAVLAVPYAALRTQQDVASAAGVIGLDMETVQQQLAQARDEGTQAGPMSANGDSTANESANTITLPDGRTVEIPEGVNRSVVESAMEKARNRDFQSMTGEERGVMRRVFQRGGGRRRPNRSQSDVDAQMGGRYIVFAVRNGAAVAVPVRTGLTDLDYAEVVSGLSEDDTVMILPSASLIAEQQGFQERVQRMTGGGLPGVSR